MSYRDTLLKALNFAAVTAELSDEERKELSALIDDASNGHGYAIAKAMEENGLYQFLSLHVEEVRENLEHMETDLDLEGAAEIMARQHRYGVADTATDSLYLAMQDLARERMHDSLKDSNYQPFKVTVDWEPAGRDEYILFAKNIHDAGENAKLFADTSPHYDESIESQKFTVQVSEHNREDIAPGTEVFTTAGRDQNIALKMPATASAPAP